MAPYVRTVKTAERELAEELGLHRKPGRLLVIDWAPHPAEGDKLLFIFDCGTLTPAFALTATKSTRPATGPLTASMT